MTITSCTNAIFWLRYPSLFPLMLTPSPLHFSRLKSCTLLEHSLGQMGKKQCDFTHVVHSWVWHNTSWQITLGQSWAIHFSATYPYAISSQYNLMASGLEMVHFCGVWSVCPFNYTLSTIVDLNLGAKECINWREHWARGYVNTCPIKMRSKPMTRKCLCQAKVILSWELSRQV